MGCQSTSIMLKIGNQLKEIRKERDMKQDTMADLLGISQTKYSRIESNQKGVKHEEAKAFEKVLALEDDEELSDESTNKTINIYNNKIETQIAEQNYYHISPKIEKLYEDKILLLEEKIRTLEKRL